MKPFVPYSVCVWAAVLATSASVLSAPVPSPAREAASDPTVRLLRDASIMLLKEGNARYAADKPQHPHLDAERRASTGVQGQEPFATILACSDSRDPVELIFDRGVGDLFVVRVAGNVAGLSELATMEYGVSHLHTPLLVVMGHTKCDAVTAVVQGSELHGHLQALAERIKPAASKAKTDGGEPEETVLKAIQANVWQSIEDTIRQSSIVREKVNAGSLSLLGAIYDVESGKVNWLGPHPAQEALIALAAQAETDAALAKKLALQESGLPGARSLRRTLPAPASVAENENEHPEPASARSAPAKGGGH